MRHCGGVSTLRSVHANATDAIERISVGIRCRIIVADSNSEMLMLHMIRHNEDIRLILHTLPRSVGRFISLIKS